MVRGAVLPLIEAQPRRARLSQASLTELSRRRPRQRRGPVTDRTQGVGCPLMEATLAGRGVRGAKARPGRSAKGAGSAAELREVLEDVLEAVEADETAGTLVRAAGPRLRIEITDRALVLNLAPSDEPSRKLRWRFDDEIDWEPRLRIWM